MVAGRRGASPRPAAQPWVTASLVTQMLTLIGIGGILLNIVFFSTVQTSSSNRRLGDSGGGTASVFGADDQDSRQIVLDIFEEAGVRLTDEELDELPLWDEVLERIGEPIVYNTESCPRFRDAVQGVERNIGSSGMFNSGTNLVTQLLKENCKIPERVAKYGMDGPFQDSQGKAIGPGEAHGIRWQVPWGKHMPNNYRSGHSTKWAFHICKECVLPVVTIRHPYDWMEAMCRNHYTAYWPHNDKELCPNLVNKRHQNVSVRVKYDQHEDHHTNLAALWNDWYAKFYHDSNDPFIMVRFEDAIFHPKNVTTQICECAGGKIRTDRPFTYIIETAKTGPGHGKVKERTGMVKAWIKYSKPIKPQGGFETRDYEGAIATLDTDLMSIFGYQHPEPKVDTTQVE